MFHRPQDTPAPAGPVRGSGTASGLVRPRTTRSAALAALSVAGLVLIAGCSTDTTVSPAGTPSSSATSSATSSASASAQTDASGCITNFNADTDYYPVKQTISDADNFTISYHKSYQVLTVKQPVVGGKPVSYVLVKCGAPKPQLSGTLASAESVTTPVHSLFSASTTQLPALVELDKLSVLTGVAAKAYISEPTVVQHVRGSTVTEFAPAGTTDAEKVVAAKPDVLITGGTDDPAYATIEKAGIAVLAAADFLEANPLGRAEWVKYFAALTGTEQQATAQFDQISNDYDAVVAKAKSATAVPLLVSQPYQGVWSMPAGGSFAGKLLSNAGGTWPWRSNASTGSISASTETVFDKSGTAKLWINTSNWKTKAEALKEESRFADFTAFTSGQVWSPSLQVNSAGGNNYFELGVQRPDLVEADLIAIVHPELEPNHTFTFYRQLK